MSDQPKKTPPPPKSIRYYISPLNSSYSSTLIKQLQADQSSKPEADVIIGSLTKDSNLKEISGVRKIVDTTKVEFFKKVILDSDVIIYDLPNCDPVEVETAIQTLKLEELKTQKILICVSSVMVWSNTPPKIKKEGDEEQDDPEEPDSEQEQDDDKKQEPADGEEEVKKVYVRFTEKDFKVRKALPAYEYIKGIETLCLSAGNQTPNLKTYVLCSGILYGLGEELLYEHFKQAWLQNPQELTFLGDGKNKLPTIHLKDLVTFTKKTIEKTPQDRYIFAIDHNPKPIQKKIIKSISTGLGSGKILSVNSIDDKTKEEILTIDIRMKPTKAFDAFLEEAAAIAEDADEYPFRFTFDWWCKEGIQKNIAKLREEFNTRHGLKPIKILITGGPASGKTFFGKSIAEYYNIPLIQAQNVIEKAKELQNEFGEELRAYIQEQKDKLAEEGQAQYDLEKKKLKKLGKKVEKFDPEKVKVRISDELLVKCFLYRLAQNDCQNRGFVLDGFPKSYQQAKLLFMTLPPLQEGQDAENVEQIPNQLVLVEHVIDLNASEQFLNKRVTHLPDEIVQNTHWDIDGMTRRYQEYQKNNTRGKGIEYLCQFFENLNISILPVNLENSQNDLINNIIAFVDRNGEQFNYMDRKSEKERQRVDNIKHILKNQSEHIKQVQQLQDKKEIKQLDVVNEEYKLKCDQQLQVERELLESRSHPLRQYLNDNVVPYLIEAIGEMVRQHPENQVHFLAQYLFKKSLSVEFPDPKLYFLTKYEK